MPVSYTFEDRLFHFKCTGIYTLDEIKIEFSKAINDPDFPKNAAFLMDVSRSKSLEKRSAAEIKNMVDFICPYATRVNKKCAVLVSSDVNYGLSRMGAAFSASHGADVKVFRDNDDALAWLLN